MSADAPRLPHVDERDVIAFARDNLERYEILAESPGATAKERGAFRRHLALWTFIHARFDTVGAVVPRSSSAKRGSAGRTT